MTDVVAKGDVATGEVLAVVPLVGLEAVPRVVELELLLLRKALLPGIGLAGALAKLTEFASAFFAELPDRDRPPSFESNFEAFDSVLDSPVSLRLRLPLLPLPLPLGPDDSAMIDIGGATGGPGALGGVELPFRLESSCNFFWCSS